MRSIAKPLIVFVFALLVYLVSAWNHLYGIEYFDDSQKEYKAFHSNLNRQLRLKAGALIESNNLSPLLDKTLLRIALVLPESQFRGYRYTIESGLEVNTSTDSSVILLSDVINYVDLTSIEGTSWVRVEGI